MEFQRNLKIRVCINHRRLKSNSRRLPFRTSAKTDSSIGILLKSLLWLLESRGEITHTLIQIGSEVNKRNAQDNVSVDYYCRYCYHYRCNVMYRLTATRASDGC